MVNYEQRSLKEKIALSPSFGLGLMAGGVVSAFNKVSGRTDKSFQSNLLKQQPVSHSLAQFTHSALIGSFTVSEMLYKPTLVSEIGGLLSVPWLIASVIADHHRKDENGKGFSAMRAGYQLTKNMF